MKAMPEAHLGICQNQPYLSGGPCNEWSLCWSSLLGETTIQGFLACGVNGFYGFRAEGCESLGLRQLGLQWLRRRWSEFYEGIYPSCKFHPTGTTPSDCSSLRWERPKCCCSMISPEILFYLASALHYDSLVTGQEDLCRARAMLGVQQQRLGTAQHVSQMGISMNQGNPTIAPINIIQHMYMYIHTHISRF